MPKKYIEVSPSGDIPADWIAIDSSGITDGQVLIWNATNHAFEPGDMSGIGSVQKRKGSGIASIAGTDYVFATHSQDDMPDTDYIVLIDNLDVQITDKLTTGFTAYAAEDDIAYNFFAEKL